MKDVLLLLAIGSIAGLISGGFGVGGGIIIVPALVIIMKYSQHMAQGTSILLMLPPISIVAAYNFYIEGFVDIKVALILMVSFIFGGFYGAKVALNLPEFTIKKIFGVFMVLTGLKMIFG